MPCSYALLASRVPARRWSTRADLAASLAAGREHIESYELRDVTPASAARCAGLSPFHFQRLFRAVYGVTPHQLIAARRLKHAAHLLTSTRMPLWRVGREVGLAGAPALCRFLRSNAGITAGRLRR